MPIPHSQSVTSTPCNCGYLERSANDAHKPIVFDPTENRYHYCYDYRGRSAHLMIYHCPWCGGVASGSHRANRFHVLKTEQCKEITQKVAACETLEAIIAILGQPDGDGPTIIKHHETDDSPPRIDCVRQITYDKLYVEMSVAFEQRIGGNIGCSFVPKPLATSK
jgi:hypothetical protein